MKLSAIISLVVVFMSSLCGLVFLDTKGLKDNALEGIYKIKEQGKPINVTIRKPKEVVMINATVDDNNDEEPSTPAKEPKEEEEGRAQPAATEEAAPTATAGEDTKIVPPLVEEATSPLLATGKEEKEKGVPAPVKEEEKVVPKTFLLTEHPPTVNSTHHKATNNESKEEEKKVVPNIMPAQHPPTVNSTHHKATNDSYNYKTELLRATIPTVRDILYERMSTTPVTSKTTSPWKPLMLQILPTPSKRTSVIESAVSAHLLKNNKQRRRRLRRNKKPLNKNPPAVYDDGTTPKICMPQPMWSDHQESAKLTKMHHGLGLREAKDAIVAFTNRTTNSSSSRFNNNKDNYFAANYSALRQELELDQYLIPDDPQKEKTLATTTTPRIHNAAICKISPSVGGHIKHFAHAMQLLYSCFDFWMEHATTTSLLLPPVVKNNNNNGTTQRTSNNNNQTGGGAVVRPILVYDNESQGESLKWAFENNSFIKGIYDFLTTQIDLVVMSFDEYYDCHLHHHHHDHDHHANTNTTRKEDHPTPTTTTTTKSSRLCREVYHPEQTMRTVELAPSGYFFEHVYEWNRWMDRYLNQKKRRQRLLGTKNDHDVHHHHDEDYHDYKDDDDVCSHPPRIGILNRIKNRGVLNAFDLAIDLSNMIYVYERDNNIETHPPQGGEEEEFDDTDSRNNNNMDNNNNNSTKNNNNNRRSLKRSVQVTYFEGKSFVEQVEFFRKTDILISPHGAQLTGLAFMANDHDQSQSHGLASIVAADDDTAENNDSNNNNNKDHRHQTSSFNGKLKSCKQIMELFPKNYAIPAYFGSLAVQSGMSHSYVYFDYDNNNDERSSSHPTPRQVMPWESVSASTYEERSYARAANFCPRTDDVLSYVAELIWDWYRCHGCKDVV